MAKITELAANRQAENDAFSQLVQSKNSDTIDAMVGALNAEIAPQINCTECGNCCRSLMINVTTEEADTLAEHLRQTREEFDQQYLEKGAHGTMLLNTIPCHFLNNNHCTVYEHRFAGCREFPAMHLPGFSKRLFTTFMHYDRCPIIYNIVEALKTQLGFERTI